MKAISMYSALLFFSFFASKVASFSPLLPSPRIRNNNARSVRLAAERKGFFPWESKTKEESSSKEVISEQNEDDKSESEKRPSSIVKQVFSPMGALVVLAGVVLFHECGHYLTARSFGVRAEEFSIGFGPKLFGFQAFGGDTFNLRLLPLGGYVSLPNEELENLPLAQRIVILSAGVFFNLVMAFAIYFGQITVGPGLPEPLFEQGVVVSGVTSEGPAHGILKTGDVIMGIKGRELKMPSSPSEAEAQRTISKIISTTQSTPQGEALKLSISRDSKSLDVTVTPTSIEELSPPTMGVFLQPNFAGINLVKKDSTPEAAMLALGTVASVTKATATGLVTFARDFFRGKSESSEYRVRGPMGVVERASQVVATNDVNTILKYAATLSINLGVFNTFPVPPSDGFRIATTLVSEAMSTFS